MCWAYGIVDIAELMYLTGGEARNCSCWVQSQVKKPGSDNWLIPRIQLTCKSWDILQNIRGYTLAPAGSLSVIVLNFK